MLHWEKLSGTLPSRNQREGRHNGYGGKSQGKGVLGPQFFALANRISEDFELPRRIESDYYQTEEDLFKQETNKHRLGFF